MYFTRNKGRNLSIKKYLILPLPGVRLCHIQPQGMTWCRICQSGSVRFSDKQ